MEYFTDKEVALDFLRKSEYIMIPQLFTYWAHSTQRKVGDTTSIRRGLWEDLPLDGFVIKGEMSFLDEVSRMKYTLYTHSLENIPVAYAPDREADNLKGFQIKVIIPRANLTLEQFGSLQKDENYISKLRYEDNGMGDGRHAKLPKDTLIHVFGGMMYDEMSGKTCDTVIGVRDEDLLCYADSVKEMYERLSPDEIENHLIHYDEPLSSDDLYETMQVPRVMGKNRYSRFLGINDKNNDGTLVGSANIREMT